MSGIRDRSNRKAAKEAAAAVAAAQAPTIEVIAQNAAIAIGNELKTRARVDVLEQQTGLLAQLYGPLAAVRGRNLKGRLTWLLLGR